MPPTERAEKQAAAQQAVDILHEIATLLVSLKHQAHHRH
jgi:mitotic-spindle organizing protein 1